MKEGMERGWHSKGHLHYNWKSNPNYRTLHKWVYRNKPKLQECENCGTTGIPLECANISGEYTRNLSDYKWLCRKCHMESDGRLGNLKQGLDAIHTTEIYSEHGIRICSKCKEIKPLPEFAPNKYKKSGKQSYCRRCGSNACKQARLKRGVTDGNKG